MLRNLTEDKIETLEMMLINMKYLLPYKSFNENNEPDTTTTFIVSGKSMDMNIARKKSETNLKKLEQMFKKEFNKIGQKVDKDNDTYIYNIEASVNIDSKQLDAFNKAMSKYENIPFKIKS